MALNNIVAFIIFAGVILFFLHVILGAPTP